jgi:thiamine kinase
MPAGGEVPARVTAIALDLKAGAIRDVAPIKHGLSNRSWLVTTESDRFVVRISDKAAAELQIDRHSEAIVLGAVAHAGIGPEVLLCDPRRSILVTRYLGPTWQETDARRADNIDRLASLLRRLHQIKAPSGARRVELASIARGYLRTLDERGVRSDLTLPAMRRSADVRSLELSQGSTPCLCHNDVHHLNVVDGERLRLIDWEYAGIGEPLFDLAAVCVYHSYDRGERERLLSAYGTAPAAISDQRLELACWLFDYIRQLWIAVR